MSVSLLAVAGGVIGAIAGVVSVVVAVKIGMPRSKLLYETTRLMRVFADPELATYVDASRHGVKVCDPYVAEVRLVNRGAWDIPITAFARPIELDAQVEIVDVLAIWVVPATSETPAVRLQGSALQVEPFLIGRRQQVCLRLLTDGCPRIRARASIERVEVQAVGPPPPTLRHRRVGVIAASAVAITAAMAVATARLTALAARAADERGPTGRRRWLRRRS